VTLKERLFYRTGFNGKGFIRELPPAEWPKVPLPKPESVPTPDAPENGTLPTVPKQDAKPRQQFLFDM
jgi:hypothetical protein